MRKLFYYIEISNISPVHIGNGNSDYTDLDVIKDKSNVFFIPGTSLAGCIFHSLPENDRKIFNPLDSNGMNKQSPFFVSDAKMIEGQKNVEIRDGIALTLDKVTKDGNKYDFEIVPAGHKFVFRIEVMDREDNEDYERIIDYILASFENHDIRIGYKTTRGLGIFNIDYVGQKIFDQHNFEEYFNFDNMDIAQYNKYEIKPLKSKYLTIKVDLKQRGGISIRSYQTKKEKADSIHIHSAKKPVIPGTSWNGLFRKSVYHYLSFIQDDLDLKIQDIFGSEIEDEDRIKSKIYFSESTIENYELITMVRNQINRFNGSTIDGSLYTEESCYGGNTSLTISLKKDEFSNEELEYIKEILLLIIKDIDNGFIALGGQTSIGRGLFLVEHIFVDDEQIDLNSLEDILC